VPKIVRFHETGDADVLQIDDLPMPEAGAGEVVINVDAFGLNRAEIMFRRGEYPQYAPELPSTIGYEAACTVAAVGEGVDTCRVGDLVSTIPSFKMGRYWSYGEVARVPATAVAHYPQRLSAVEAAAIWMPYVTAYGALIEYGRVTAGDTVIVTAASSSVGVAMLQIIKSIGAKAIAVTTSETKRDFVLAQQPEHLIISSQEDLAPRILEITEGKGAEFAFDPVSGPAVLELAKAIAYQGKIFIYGRLDATPTDFPVGLGLSKGLTIRGYSLFEVVNFLAVYQRAIKHVYDRLEDGSYQPVIDSVFALENVADAHRHMASNTQMGKIIVEV
jgi:NADPH:quinone reductase-like Zn-dependent oxidoreductase